MAFSVPPTVQIHFPEISLLITHYNRSSSLQKLLTSFESLKCTFGEIIVSDDGSRKEHLNKLIELSNRFQFKLILAEKNSGLGNNINKGQNAILNKYTLYVQEDFAPTPNFPENLKVALGFMDLDADLDIIRFYAYIPYPYLEHSEKGFSKMYLPHFGLNYTKIYQYSDHPHLRRSTFLTKFGRYKEGLNPEKTEYKMCVSFIKNKGKGLFFNDFKKLFIQENSTLEPSTMKRGRLRRSDNFYIKIVRDVYRQLKNNYHIHFTR
jgi:glycosyltransferase involved in cell wall biosynthesis